MSSALFYTLLAVLGVSLVSLVGILLLFVQEQKLRSRLFILVSLAVGALFGDVFFHIIPELFESGVSVENMSFGILGGLLLFFILEKVLHWRHQHIPCEAHKECVEPFGYMNLISDALHNFIDGALIASSFLVSTEIGVATTIAILLHEIPQELGDFGVLIEAGFNRTKALLFNLLSALFAIAGAMVAYFLLPNLQNWILPIAAGGFLYIAGSDLVPELHKTTSIRKTILQFIGIIVGMGLMYGLLWMEI
ncbi:MAG: zinc/iron permease [Parcubacteria group bacterium Gr01-1014_18]|nr:MAG: zinc/iron permease [Parcubacteria group bacterium Greene0416_36]TSC81263.1 MAG: zinc/iron permease [Parcubacteria group bacterium Gr01-1014_18]TSC99285.1 MAG: zinc/iron permease [Parcubacteria group bacterium Greene1014_20]TSD06878.1 MAG: zinc/iron permease [Parcubacteria group bacterium Greene0714_2]